MIYGHGDDLYRYGGQVKANFSSDICQSAGLGSLKRHLAARLDDVANYIPARLTALLMTLVAGRPKLVKFVVRNGRKHASPNSGYPEAALAGMLDCRFGGGHYFNEYVEKPFIGDNYRRLTADDVDMAVRINWHTELMMAVLVALVRLLPAYGWLWYMLPVFR